MDINTRKCRYIYTIYVYASMHKYIYIYIQFVGNDFAWLLELTYILGMISQIFAEI